MSVVQVFSAAASGSPDSHGAHAPCTSPQRWRVHHTVASVLYGCFILVAQTSTMFQIWGDLALMTNAAFLLFTNLAFALKIINVLVRRRDIKSIIDESNIELSTEYRQKGIQIVESCNRETTQSMYLYMWLSGVTVLGWVVSAEKNQLPLRAWYPYDTSKSPAYEITYANQSTALSVAATTNICLDTLVTSLIAVCRCRLRLVALSLRTLCDDIQIPDKQLMTPEYEQIVYKRLQLCVMKHEAALRTARQIQRCFTYPILAQFTVSVVIICVTAYQLAIELNNGKWVRIISMVAYLLCMMLQVFLYCYQGNQLTEESSEIADAAYECPWYSCSLRTRKALLIVMVRTRRALCLTAGGFTTLSLACFTSIIKASYTFFTVLKQVEDRNPK
ncbi:odorant receptor 46a-like [Trichoplusia ni]|uniref:Odorant receptor n=1 Tax=Trichoplusia ni TaxID=7111 RepID=A0A7E5W3G2_TRINI|nr:odorant receptor 46a-like [Trichoplusia ni]